MNVLVKLDAINLPKLVDRAAKALASARSSAEILEARMLAGVAYDAAKKTARFAKAKGAHDALIVNCRGAQADALEIESGARRRLADEYDQAQERGEVQKRGGDGNSKTEVPTAADIGLTSKDIFESRLFRDAEKHAPGIVRRTLDELLAEGTEPTKTRLQVVIAKAVLHHMRSENESEKGNGKRRGKNKKKQEGPAPYRNEWIDWTVAVKHLASVPKCGLNVLAERSPYELDRLQDEAARALVNLKLWCSVLGREK